MRPCPVQAALSGHERFGQALSIEGLGFFEDAAKVRGPESRFEVIGLTRRTEVELATNRRA